LHRITNQYSAVAQNFQQDLYPLQKITSPRTEREIICHFLETLTPRSIDVLDQIINGQLNKIISQNLDINLRTVEAHRARVMEKIQASSVTDLTKKSPPRPQELLDIRRFYQPITVIPNNQRTI